jgi:phospholipase C
MTGRLCLRALLAVPLCAVALLLAATPASAKEPATATPVQHLVVLMQGDRTFDNYFGTYPGTDGIPANACQVLVLVRPTNGCVKPYAAHGRVISPLAAGKTVLDAQFNGGKMNGFVAAFGAQGRDGIGAMAHYDRRDLPFSWAAADDYVLFDKFFPSAFYGTRANRAYWVAAAPPPSGAAATAGYAGQPTIFDRLQQAGVSWKFYVQDYDPKQTFRAATPTAPVGQTVRVPLLNYPRFVDDPALRSHIVDLSEYYRDLTRGTLPAVAYVASGGASERSARSIGAGQKLIQDLTTQLMLSPYWARSAMMWTYDGSGGWYDHVTPPVLGGQRAGFRVPTLLVSPYARRGVVDHTVLDYTSVLRFVEDNWHVAPLTDRDRNAASIAGAFDFSAPARPAELISPFAGEPLAAVQVQAAYLAYGGASALGLGVFAFALAGPATLWPGRVRRVGRGARRAGSFLLRPGVRGWALVRAARQRWWPPEWLPGSWRRGRVRQVDIEKRLG